MATTKTAKKPKQPAQPDPAQTLSPHSTEAAFNAVKAQLDALPLSELSQPNFNLQEGAFVALAADGLLREPATRAKIEALAKAQTIDLPLVDNLATMARAAWFVRHKLSFAEALHSDASLPVKLVTEALETRRRMLKTLAYQLDEDPEAQRKLTSIRDGSGHVDTANDLLALADMYADYEDEVKDDTKNYRATDVKLARELADKIIAALGGPSTPEAKQWRNYQARAYTLLDRHHQEAIRVGRFLWHYERGDELFPTMFAAVRARPARKASPEAPPASPAEGEAKSG